MGALAGTTVSERGKAELRAGMMMYAGAVLLAVAAAIWLYLRGGGGRSKKGEHSNLENAGEEEGAGEEVEDLGRGDLENAGEDGEGEDVGELGKGDLENAGEEGGVGEVEELGKGFDYIIVGAGSSWVVGVCAGVEAGTGGEVGAGACRWELDLQQ
ncbi:hypothetical protein T484DRAFT_1834206 [Baffinella frigidus]|nr:hypothetical protein T484DRAFT_1834206 [Cryptophyta sp. CCMP2293]